MSLKPRLSREFIDYHAFGMVRHLQREGHIAYLVGGCVRDLLVGHTPKDFDIGTSALPQQVKRLISHAYIIGRRFRLVLVKREDKQYEVATFRREPREGEFPDVAPAGDNIFGSPEEDAFRRDFTCNALFYDPVGDRIIDYVDGKPDIEDHLIKMIGDPCVRLREDPIRILRALRFAHKLSFKINRSLKEQMHAHAPSLMESVLPRRREEYLKLLRLPDPAAAFREGFDLNLWAHVLPELHGVYENDEAVDRLEERLRRIESRLIDSQNTSLLGGSLVLGWIRAHLEPHDRPLSMGYFQDDAQLAGLLSNLGLHNSEVSFIRRALSLQRILAEPDIFLRKGGRRQKALLQNEVFPLAVDLAHIDAVLPPDILDFWDEQLEMATNRSLLTH